MDFFSTLSLLRYVFAGFTDRTLNILSAAAKDAAARNHQYVTPEHVLLAIAKAEPGVGYVALEHVGVDLRTEVPQLERAVSATATEQQASQAVSFSPETKHVLAAAKAESRGLGHNWVDSEHILLGLTSYGPSPVNDILQRNGITPARIRDEVLKLLSHAT